MCRFVAYMGHDIVIDNVLMKPSNSLVDQSLHARETQYVTNGDGFGLGWYAKAITPQPAIFKAITPAWNNQNLHHIASKVQTDCFFAHVRASTGGGVNHNNCHPFDWNDYLFMHNGGVGNFPHVKRHLRHQLDDATYECIRGETDTEHVFALMIQHLKQLTYPTTDDLVAIFKKTLTQVNQLVQTYGDNAPSHLNLCLTNGRQMLISRYTSRPDSGPASSLYYAQGSSFAYDHGDVHMVGTDEAKGCTIVCSEKLNDHLIEWHHVAENQLVVVDSDHSLSLHDLSDTLLNS